MANNELSDEEKALFRHHMNDVTPLAKNIKSKDPKHQTLPKPQKQAHKHPPYQRESKIPELKKLDIYLSNAYQEPVYAHTTLSFTHVNFPSKRFRELRHGLIRWEARLDLHGLRGEDAEEALLIFLAKQLDLNHRCVLIIHGKGGIIINDAPVLKNLINHWLRQIPQVFAFHSATPKDGGTGAVYVFLKRQ